MAPPITSRQNSPVLCDKVSISCSLVFSISRQAFATAVTAFYLISLLAKGEGAKRSLESIMFKLSGQKFSSATKRCCFLTKQPTPALVTLFPRESRCIFSTFRPLPVVACRLRQTCLNLSFVQSSSLAPAVYAVQKSTSNPPFPFTSFPTCNTTTKPPALLCSSLFVPPLTPTLPLSLFYTSSSPGFFPSCLLRSLTFKKVPKLSAMRINQKKRFFARQSRTSSHRYGAQPDLRSSTSPRTAKQ